MKTRVVHTKLWKDEWFCNLSKEAKLLWLYLISGERVNISGVFELTDREILFDTSIDTSILTSIKEELKPKAIFSKGWVRVCNVNKYNKYLNTPLNVLACIRELEYVPEEIKKDLNIPFDTSIYTSHKSEIINQKQETKEQKEERMRLLKEKVYKNMGWKLD